MSTVVGKSTLEKIYPIENIIKPRFTHNWKLGVEFSQFRIDKIGKYTIKIQNAENLIVKPSMIFSIRYFQKELSTDSIQILIKESISTTKKFLSIIFLILGLNMAIWGFILSFIPEILN